MNNRPDFINKNEWVRQKTSMPRNQYSPNVASSHNLRPFYRHPEKFYNEYIAQPNKPKTSTFNLQFNVESARQTSYAAVNFPPNAIPTARITHSNSIPSYQNQPSFQGCQNFHGLRQETQMRGTNSSIPSQFNKIPCNLASVQSSQRNENYSSSISNVNNVPMHVQSINLNDISTQSHAYRTSLTAKIELTPNSNNNSFVRQPTPMVSNVSEFIRQPLQPNSNISTFFRQPPPLSSNLPNLVKPSLPQGFKNTDVRHNIPPGSVNPNTVRQPSLYSNNQDFTTQPVSLNLNNPDSKRQLFLPVSSNGEFIKQPPDFDYLKQNLMRPPPLQSVIQPPLNVSSSSVSSGNFTCSLQNQCAPPTVVAPFTALKLDPQLNIVYAPNVTVPPPPINPDCLEENKLNKFLERFTEKEKVALKSDLTVAEFRSKLKNTFNSVKKLVELKASLLNLVDGNENEWKEKLKETLDYKDQLSKECDYISEPKLIIRIQQKLKNRKRKRELIKKTRLNLVKEKAKNIANREELHQTIDKWLEAINEKNLKLKREVEMKKEADSILGEVRRKIHETKCTLDKIKVFEKIRNVRHDNAEKKGLFLPEHNKKFKTKISELKVLLMKQLSDYEGEQKALKVMLDAEQEGQLEEEALWRIKKLKTLQQRRQKNITESLFGNEEEPTEKDPRFLFHQFQNFGNKSIENLVQIRHQWDLYLNKDGEAVPFQWVVPAPPSNAAWEVALKS